MEDREKIFKGKNNSKNKNIFRFIFFSILCSLFSILFLSFCSLAYAEIVVLKNGRVMTGRIVEKNPTYLVLKTGEGEEAVRTTIFLEDISRIEGEEQSRSAFGDSRQSIRNLIEQDLRFKAEGNADDADSEAFQEQAESPEPIYTPYEALEEPVAPEEPAAGGGEISGTITLPFSPFTAPRQTGASDALYVYLTKPDAKGPQTMPVSGLFDRISAESITSMLVSYAIRNVPLGRYRVVAVWDIANPPITVRIAEGKKILNLTLEKGDYRGTYGNIVEVTRDADNIGGINFDCSTFNEAGVTGPDLSGFSFEVTDVYYSRMADQEGQIVMTVKNTGPKPIADLVLGIAIDNRWSPYPVVVGALPPGVEKPFDITSFYVAHLASMGEIPDQVVRTVQIKFRHITGETIFEKTIQIF